RDYRGAFRSGGRKLPGRQFARLWILRPCDAPDLRDRDSGVRRDSAWLAAGEGVVCAARQCEGHRGRLLAGGTADLLSLSRPAAALRARAAGGGKRRGGAPPKARGGGHAAPKGGPPHGPTGWDDRAPV